MTQPKFAPTLESGEVRDILKLPVPEPWTTHRPADYRPAPHRSERPNGGIPGPDQGYALYLAERLHDRLRLTGNERADDVLVGAVMIGLRRASLFGRAPVTADVELALELFGYLDEALPDQIEAREQHFSGAAHDYWQQRDIADGVPESTLRLTLPEVRRRLAADPQAWRALAGVSA
ncbi:MAG TPA: hypothetical protein VKA05_03140 [Acidimicrobiales bacterium]|nr:hypothetical protein [Acidimicrobiales bacterium]